MVTGVFGDGGFGDGGFGGFTGRRFWRRRFWRPKRRFWRPNIYNFVFIYNFVTYNKEICGRKTWGHKLTTLINSSLCSVLLQCFILRIR